MYDQCNMWDVIILKNNVYLKFNLTVHLISYLSTLWWWAHANCSGKKEIPGERSVTLVSSRYLHHQVDMGWV